MKHTPWFTILLLSLIFTAPVGAQGHVVSHFIDTP